MISIIFTLMADHNNYNTNVKVDGGRCDSPPTTKSKNSFTEINNLEKLLARVTLILSIPVLGFIVLDILRERVGL